MSYQSFPGATGSSRSADKLRRLRFPSLAGKTFLDMGCNQGYFCGFALFQGASRVVGIDRSKKSIEQARARFPEAEFYCQSWDDPLAGQFDVILLASALHYASDQPALIDQLMKRLTPEGVLVLELGIAKGGEDAWVEVKRSIDTRPFPTLAKLKTVLEPYAWRLVGESVRQGGDPVPRSVVHARVPLPMVYLLLNDSGTGKTTLARRLFEPTQVPVVSGDKIFHRIATGRMDGPDTISGLIRKVFQPAGIGGLTKQLLEHGYLEDLVALWIQVAQNRDFALDSFVPEPWREALAEAFRKRGYIPVRMSWEIDQTTSTRAVSEDQAKAYEHSLGGKKLASIQQVQIEKLPTAELPLALRWHLDSPKNFDNLADQKAVTIKGWLMPGSQPETSLRLYVSSGRKMEFFTLDRQRLDVVKSCFGRLDDCPEFVREFNNGFEFRINRAWLRHRTEFGLEYGEERIPLAFLWIPDSSGSQDLTRRFQKWLKQV